MIHIPNTPPHVNKPDIVLELANFAVFAVGKEAQVGCVAETYTAEWVYRLLGIFLCDPNRSATMEVLLNCFYQEHNQLLVDTHRLENPS